MAYIRSHKVPNALPVSFFFFNDTATTEIYTLSLHDALPISGPNTGGMGACAPVDVDRALMSRIEREVIAPSIDGMRAEDRKSTRLNSSHSQISYAVFCLKKKKTIATTG